MEESGGKQVGVEFILDRNAFELADQLISASAELCAFEDFGPYTIREPIGRGRMGEVFLAEEYCRKQECPVQERMRLFRAVC